MTRAGDRGDRVDKGHWVHAAVRELFGVRQGASPRWMIDAADRLPEHETPLGTRVMLSVPWLPDSAQLWPPQKLPRVHLGGQPDDDFRALRTTRSGPQLSEPD